MSRNGASSPQDGAGGAGMGGQVPVEGRKAPAGAQGVTEADRERAGRLYLDCRSVASRRYSATEAIAVALAEERAKARAPFLQAGLQLTALAERYQSEWLEFGGPVADCIRSNAYADAALRIRRAAEDTP
ncbi:MAG: hypothetical protein JWM36_4882 [Hyphomicrobiales bacterium]|nr:hypothetical protein [Hyphomicrobiales bacterium]